MYSLQCVLLLFALLTFIFSKLMSVQVRNAEALRKCVLHCSTAVHLNLLTQITLLHVQDLDLKGQEDITSCVSHYAW
jgi:hypothetical protein